MATMDQTNWIPGTRYFAQVSDSDHTAWLYIITLLSMSYIAIVFVIRFVVKYGMYGNDDWALLVSTILASAQHFALFGGIAKGMGKSTALLSQGAIDTIESYAAMHAFLFILSHCASKLSTALLTRRLFFNGRALNRYCCWVLLGASAVYGVWSILALAVACPSPGFALQASDQCSNRFLRWQLVTAMDIFTELILTVLPAVLILDVQIKQNAKMLVAAVFAVRLPDIIFALLNLYSHPTAYDPHTDLGLRVVLPIIWTQTELLWSIVAASVPCLKTFMRPFDKIDEDTWRSHNDPYTSQSGIQHSWRDPRDGSVPLEHIKGHKHGMILPNGRYKGGQMSDPQAGRVGHNVVIGPATDNGSEDEHRRSWGSQDRIIKTERHWEVTTETSPRDPYVIP